MIVFSFEGDMVFKQKLYGGMSHIRCSLAIRCYSLSNVSSIQSVTCMRNRTTPL